MRINSIYEYKLNCQDTNILCFYQKNTWSECLRLKPQLEPLPAILQ